MRRIFLAYIKYKVLSILKDDLIKYMNGQSDSISRRDFWQAKEYNPILDGRKEKFDKHKEGQIKFSQDCYVENHHKANAVSELIKTIKEEL